MAGDFNGDGKADVGSFYNYGSGNTGLFVWYSSGAGFNAPVLAWLSGAGNWWDSAHKPVAGDFNGDGKADVGSFYDYGSSNTALFVWKSNGPAFELPALAWLSGVGNWSGTAHKPVAADFTGDGKSDVGSFYNYGSGTTGLFTWHSNGPGFNSPSRVWLSCTACYGFEYSKPVAGDFSGDGKADVGALYNYGASNTGLIRWYSNGPGFSHPALTWISGVGNWQWTVTKQT